MFSFVFQPGLHEAGDLAVSDGAPAAVVAPDLLHHLLGLDEVGDVAVLVAAAAEEPGAGAAAAAPREQGVAEPGIKSSRL